MCSSIEDVHNLLQPTTMVAMGHSFQARPPKIRKQPRAKTAPSRPLNWTPDPSKFLRKNQRVRDPPQIDRNDYKCVLQAPRPPIPKSAAPLTARSQKNYVMENVKFVEKLEAKQPVQRIVVSCRGERQDMTRLLEGKQYRESRSFGQIPKYLTARKKAWDRELDCRQKMIAQADLEKSDMPGYRQVPEEERQRLLKGLKERWSEVYKQFQVLPVICDTVPKIKRKLCLERQITELEKDIALIENNPFIYLEEQHDNY